MTQDIADRHDDQPRAVITGAFRLLDSLRRRGSARVVDLQRDCDMPRTTVTRLLTQLLEVGAVARYASQWRLGPTMIELGSGPAAHPHLESVSRRPLMELAVNTGALVVLSVEMADRCMVTDVLPGTQPIAREPHPGMDISENAGPSGFDPDNLAAVRVFRQARNGDFRAAIDAGRTHPKISCCAAPLRVTPTNIAVVWLMLPSGDGIPDAMVAAARRTAGRIGTRLAHITEQLS